MKYIGLMFAFALTLGGTGSVAIADDAQEALFAFPDLERLRHHDAPKVVRVRFSEEIDRRSFRVLLNGKEVTDGVEPLPGEREVSLPFEVGRNEVVFSARRAGRPDAAIEKARFNVRYRPPGDVMVRGGAISMADTPENRALVEEMMDAARTGDLEKMQRLQNEMRARQQGK